jgi:hypothetical protein
LGQPVDMVCPYAKCDTWTGVSVFALPGPSTRWNVVLRCQRGHVWFMAAKGVKLLHPHTVRRGRAPGTWDFSAFVDDFALAERILQRWSREYPGHYAAIESRSGTVVGPLRLGAGKPRPAE